ncbi:MAG TPA: hypothetical protein P5148_03065, partial [Anaerolineae bacterium]|nr:hypothetical protein [Anaerolineae bacterium]
NVVSSPLMENVQRTHGVAELIKAGRYQEAMAARGSALSSHLRYSKPCCRRTRVSHNRVNASYGWL